MRERVDLRALRGVAVNPAETREGVHAVDVHRARATNTLPTRPTERQRRVHLVLDFNKRIEHLFEKKKEIQGKKLRMRHEGLDGGCAAEQTQTHHGTALVQVDRV